MQVQRAMADKLIRNSFFVGVCLIGLLLIGYYIFPAQRVAPPRSFRPQWYQSPDVQSTIARVNREFRKSWEDRSVQPTAQADKLTIARRLSLGLTGTIPSLEEIRALQQQPEDQQINWWIARLLEDRRYADYFAERLARAFVGTENGPFLIYRRRRFVSWLSDQVHENLPYDEIVRRLLTDEGLWTSSPAVNFVTVTTTDEREGQPDPVRLAGRTSRAMLGMRIDCLQCHDDFLGTMNLGNAHDRVGGSQLHFHQLAAFFSQVQNSLGGVRDQPQLPEYEYRFLDEELPRTVQPDVPFAEHLLTPDANRRAQLAHWLTHPQNQPFARAIVNRVWATMCGRPLVEPVDDIPLFGPYPPALETLAEDLVEHGYDLQRLIRLIAMSEVFSLDSQAEFPITAEHERYWASFPLTRLRPDQMAGAIIQSTSLTTLDSTAHVLVRLIGFGEQADFVRRYGDAGEDEFVAGGGTVSQRLLMMNGQLVRDRIAGGLNAPGQIATWGPTPETMVQTAYLATLSRQCDPAELEHFASRLRGVDNDQRIAQLQDLYWTLLNSAEFAWNH